MLVSPSYDISAAGSLASATLCAQCQDAQTPGQATALAAAPRAAVAAPRQLACKAAWRRLVDALLSPISGETFERASRV